MMFFVPSAVPAIAGGAAAGRLIKGMTTKKSPTFRCHDCGNIACEYMVRDSVWNRAWPEYREKKALLVAEHPNERWKTHLLLCFECLQRRLNRSLVPEDFDLHLVINHGILLGLTNLRTEIRTVARELRSGERSHTDVANWLLDLDERLHTPNAENPRGDGGGRSRSC
jgi:hypothetical protein